jgi:drug/metabolite transporter (DMT)-like permease
MLCPPRDLMPNRPVLLLILSALLWSLGGVLIKSIDWNPLAIAGSRSLIAVFLLTAGVPGAWRRFSPGIGASAAAYAGTVTSFVLATKLTSAANAIFLQYTAPVYIALLSPVLLQERTHGSDWFFLGWALLGVGTFFLDRFSPGGLWGMGFALLSGLFFGSFIMLLRSQRETSPESAILYGNLLTVLVALPFMWPPSHLETNWPWLVALGVFQLTLPYVLYTSAIRHVRALDAALITFIEPILNPLWVMLVNHEAPTNWSLLGGGLVLSATATRSIVLARGK